MPAAHDSSPQKVMLSRRVGSIRRHAAIDTHGLKLRKPNDEINS
jgi:hypothetical protein